MAVTFLQPVKRKKTSTAAVIKHTQSPHRVATNLGNDPTAGERDGAMVGYPKRWTLREGPSEDQRRFLETLRDLGPQDNAQTPAVRKATKRACQVRGWVEWRGPDGHPDLRAWHLTIIGRNTLKPRARHSRARLSGLTLVGEAD